MLPYATESQVNSKTKELENKITNKLGDLQFKKISQTEYDALEVKDENTVYFVYEAEVSPYTFASIPSVDDSKEEAFQAIYQELQSTYSMGNDFYINVQVNSEFMYSMATGMFCSIEFMKEYFNIMQGEQTDFTKEYTIYTTAMSFVETTLISPWVKLTFSTNSELSELMGKIPDADLSYDEFIKQAEEAGLEVIKTDDVEAFKLETIDAEDIYSFTGNTYSGDELTAKYHEGVLTLLDYYKLFNAPKEA